MKYFLIFIFSSSFLFSNAQGFLIRHHVLGTSGNSTKAMLETAPGSYFGAGIVSDSITGNSQLCIVGLGAQGQVTWTKKYGTSQFQYLHNAFISRSFYKSGNNAYYTGTALDAGIRQIGVLIKFTLTGDTLWQKIYRDPDTLEDLIPQMVTTSVDGGLLITGFFQNWSSNPYNKCLLIKTDANGIELWRKKIAKAVPDVQDGKAIIQDSASKKIVIAGYQYIGNANSWNPYPNILVLDSLGIKISQLNYGVKGTIFDLIQANDKKIVVVGAKYSAQPVAGFDLETAFALKFDLNSPAVPLWSANFDQSEFTNRFTNVLELPNGDLLIGGMIDTIWPTTGDFNCRIKLIKLNQNGLVKWKRYYDYKINPPNYNNDLSLRSLHLAADKSLIGAIESANFPDPNPLLFVRWDSTGCDNSPAICQSQSTVSSVGIQLQQQIADFKMLVYPNPTNGILNLQSSDKTNELKVNITDLTGRVVKEDKIVFGEVTANLQDLSAGLYLLTVLENKKTILKVKVIKQE